MEQKNLFVRPRDAAVMLSISRTRVYEMLNSGTLPGVRLEGRTWRIPLAALEKLAQDAMKGAAEREGL